MGNYPQNWDLDSVLPHPTTPQFTEILDGFRGDLEKLAERSDKLPATQGEQATAWPEFLTEFERLEALAGDLNAFLGCHSAGDAGNKAFRQLEAQMSSFDPLRERIYTNVEFALRDATDSEFQKFVSSRPELQRNAFFLEQRRKNAAMRLPRAEELLAADLAVDGLHAWGRLYDRVSGDLRILVMEKGEVVEKSPGQIRFDSAERSVRQNNFYAAEKAWKSVADTCADSLNHIAGTRLTLYRRLGCKDHLDLPLHRNRMSRETLDAMWSTIDRRKGCLQKFLARKAKLLGLEKLTWYDTTAPLPGGEAPKADEITYDEGVDLVVKAFSAFSPDLGKFARMTNERRWIEAENRSGKRQGAFCTGFPSRRESRVFMTFTNSFDNVSTLAHELGHAYHSWVLKDEPLFLQDYPMNLAETASTFAEAVLAEERLKTARSKHEKLSILDHMLSDAVAYLMNIHARFIFENRFHVERRDGELTSARLSEIMLEAQKQAYQNTLADDGWYPDFWVSKLHFYISGLPFYNFPYTFGFLLSNGLFALAADAASGKGGGNSNFPERYRRLLIATGCQEAEAAVQSTFSYDLRQPDFWNKSLDVIERRVDEFLAASS